ncbi:MAG: YitT family protein [Lachnospiraceae bacterium]
MQTGKQKKIIRDYLCIFLGTGIMALSITFVFAPINMVTGGFTGIAIILNAITKGILTGGIPLWLTNLALNIPVFLVAFLIKGKRFIGRTAFATLSLSLWLYLLPSLDLVDGDHVLAAIFGGMLTGVGIGLVLRSQATTGGTDMVAVLLQSKLLRHYSVPQIMQVLDGTVIIVGIFLFGIKSGLYAIVAIFILSKVSDGLTEGMKFSRAAYIITACSEQVAGSIMQDLHRGVTGIKAKGMYSKEEKCMLYCVVSKKEVVWLKDLVMEIDPNAFVIVTDAREVLGEGFIELER